MQRTFLLGLMLLIATPALSDDTAAVVAQQMAADPVAATAGDGPAAEFSVPGVTLPIESATIQMDGCAPVQLSGGTITINPPETTEAQTP